MRLLSIGLATLVCTLFVHAACDQAAEPPPRAKKVLIVGIDGCRTDALLKARTPNLDRLIEAGAFADGTRILGGRDNGADTVSGPGWSSILTGVWSDKHGVRDNEFAGANFGDYPHFFVRLKQARPHAKTASVESWGEIHRRLVRGADLSEVARQPDDNDYAAADRRVAKQAAEWLARADHDALFVYFGNVDEAGHRYGFHPSVPTYRAAIEAVDQHVGRLLDAIAERPTRGGEDWLIIVCTDHGGRFTRHSKGHEMPEVVSVFLIVSGESAVRGPVKQATALVDVAATALAHLCVPAEAAWRLDGRPVGLSGSRAAAGR